MRPATIYWLWDSLRRRRAEWLYPLGCTRHPESTYSCLRAIKPSCAANFNPFTQRRRKRWGGGVEAFGGVGKVENLMDESEKYDHLVVGDREKPDGVVARIVLVFLESRTVCCDKAGSDQPLLGYWHYNCSASRVLRTHLSNLSYSWHLRWSATSSPQIEGQRRTRPEMTYVNVHATRMIAAVCLHESAVAAGRINSGGWHGGWGGGGAVDAVSLFIFPRCRAANWCPDWCALLCLHSLTWTWKRHLCTQRLEYPHCRILTKCLFTFCRLGLYFKNTSDSILQTKCVESRRIATNRHPVAMKRNDAIWNPSMY